MDIKSSNKFNREFGEYLKEHIKDKTSIFDVVSEEEYFLLFDDKKKNEYDKILEDAKKRYTTLMQLKASVEYAKSSALALYMNQANEQYRFY